MEFLYLLCEWNSDRKWPNLFVLKSYRDILNDPNIYSKPSEGQSVMATKNSFLLQKKLLHNDCYKSNKFRFFIRREISMPFTIQYFALWNIQ